MIATCGGIGTEKVVQVLDFPAGIVGVNGVMRFLVLEEPMSTDHSAVDTNHDHAPVGSKHSNEG